MVIEKIIKIVLIFVLVISLIGIGWAGNEVYKNVANKKILNGLNIRGSTFTGAQDLSRKMDSNGDWVCVNILGMDYRQAIETVNHEVGHEIFANECEDNIEECLGAVGK